eukprot:scaffold25556_cov70-Phaeocystis_antarctica.AAC.6
MDRGSMERAAIEKGGLDRVGHQPGNDTHRVHPGVLIHLQNELRMDVVHSPTQSCQHLPGWVRARARARARVRARIRAEVRAGVRPKPIPGQMLVVIWDSELHNISPHAVSAVHTAEKERVVPCGRNRSELTEPPVAQLVTSHDVICRTEYDYEASNGLRDVGNNGAIIFGAPVQGQGRSLGDSKCACSAIQVKEGQSP